MKFRRLTESLFAHEAKMPWSYSRRVRWLPQLGDIVPDFRFTTTQGPLALHAWAEGHWVYLFTHPGAFTPICTTELASMAACQPDFENRRVKVIGLSNSSVADQLSWQADIIRIYGVEVTFPMIADEERRFTGLLGAVHENHLNCTLRKSMVIGPDLRIRTISEYPVTVGRSAEETLRVIDALQTADTFNVGVPADWKRGHDCVQLDPSFGPPCLPKPAVTRHVRPYLTTLRDPWQSRTAA